MTNEELDREIYEREQQAAREHQMAHEAAYEVYLLDQARADAEREAEADLDRQMAELERSGGSVPAPHGEG